MIYILTIFMVTMQVGSQFPNITYRLKKKKCVDLVFRTEILYYEFLKHISAQTFGSQTQNHFLCTPKDLSQNNFYATFYLMGSLKCLNNFRKQEIMLSIEKNYKKTKVNQCKNWDFMFLFELEENQLELVKELKILGIILGSDLKWSSNTKYIVQKGNNSQVMDPQKT